MEQHGTGHAITRVGHEAFRSRPYEQSFIGNGLIVVDILFVLLSTAVFLSDLLAVVRHSHTLERNWWACVVPLFLSLAIFSFCTAVLLAVVRHSHTLQRNWWACVLSRPLRLPGCRAAQPQA